MGVIDQQPGLVLRRQCRQILKRCEVAIHTKDGIGSNKFVAIASRHQCGEFIDIGMRITLYICIG